MSSLDDKNMFNPLKYNHSNLPVVAY